MFAVKKSTTITGKIKSCYFENGKLYDGESNSPIDIVSILLETYGNEEFSISTSSKKDGD